MSVTPSVNFPNIIACPDRDELDAIEDVSQSITDLLLKLSISDISADFFILLLKVHAAGSSCCQRQMYVLMR